MAAFCIRKKEERYTLPNVYLSPSTQEGNPHITGGSEEQYMNKTADALVPYLRASGIRYTRNDPEKSLSQAIAQSNLGKYDMHLALHSNAAPDGLSGRLRGIDVYYYPGSASGKRMAEILVKNLKSIYPLPDRVRALASRDIQEIKKVRAPAVLAEIGYHDNIEDSNFIKNDSDEIARAIAASLSEYFGVPLADPGPVRKGIVTTGTTPLNIRDRPSTSSKIIAKAPKGAEITVYGKTGDFYTVGYGGVTGYASAQYITIM